MKKLYTSNVVEPTTEDSNKAFSEMAEKEIVLKEKLEKDIFRKWIVYFHNSIREQLELPNKLFGFATTKNTEGEAFTVILLFDKEPDENHYKIFDEDRLPYILVEE